jgi:hypothetical protein
MGAEILPKRITTRKKRNTYVPAIVGDRCLEEADWGMEQTLKAASP